MILETLNSWSICLSDDSLSKDQINVILNLLSDIEGNIALVHIHREEYRLAEKHCQRALSYAKRYELDEKAKTTLIFNALTTCCDLRRSQSDFTDAVAFAEEAYNCVAIAYDPVHPQVQEAASALIQCLIQKGNLFDAERYASLTLDSLKDKRNGVNQESEEVAKGYYNLGNVISLQDGDLNKAEMLARESLRIRVIVYGNDGHSRVGVYVYL
jgi:tetratricopeptide (TPR) repeat protein